jgi:hypothetical protein
MPAGCNDCKPAGLFLFGFTQIVCYFLYIKSFSISAMCCHRGCFKKMKQPHFFRH